MRIFLRHAQSGLETFINACADVAVIVNENDFCAIMTNQFAAFFADRVRHNDNCPITAYSADECQADALVAACRLHNDGILVEQSLVFCVCNHVKSRAGFDGTADVQTFKFHQNLCAVRICHAGQPNHRRMSHCF